MSLAAEFDALLEEIRDMRETRQLAYERDLAEIDRAYEQDLHRVEETATKHLVAALAVGSALAAAALCALAFG